MTAAVKLTEHQSYNALAVLFHGDYRKLSALRTQHPSWSAACQKNTAALEKALALWEEMTARHIRLILNTDEEFPELLKEIPWPPHALYSIGAHITPERKIAIVGTRKATAAGLDIARRLSQELAQAGLTIVSGMALGIDAISHEGALAVKAKTIAVLACGLDSIYPKQNEGLSTRIIQNSGTIISEYPPGSPALQQRFLERNRITSGLCDGIVVVEAPIKSGVKSTARFATEQNREVFVVPGMITNPNYSGSHQLIQSGAQLITNSIEILEHLNMQSGNNPVFLTEDKFDKQGEKHKIILRALQVSGMPLTVDELATISTLTVSEVLGVITELILDDIIKEENGTYFIV